MKLKALLCFLGLPHKWDYACADGFSFGRAPSITLKHKYVIKVCKRCGVPKVGDYLRVMAEENLGA